MAKPTDEQIQAQIDLALSGKNFAGMSYADGVRHALEWVLDQTEGVTPMED